MDDSLKLAPTPDDNGKGNLTDEAVEASRNTEMDNSSLAGGTDRLNNGKNREFSLIDLEDKS